jgi:hypothetical protein
MKATTLVQKYWWTILGTSFAVLGTSLSASATSLYSITQITAPGIDTYNGAQITDNGQVLVTGSTLTRYRDNPNPEYKGSAFLWKGGQTRFLELTVDSDSPGLPKDYFGININESGTVIGYVDLDGVTVKGVTYGVGSNPWQGFTWNGGEIDLSSGPYFSLYNIRPLA